MQQRPKASSFWTTRLLVGAVVLFNVLVLYSNVRSFYEDDAGQGDSGQEARFAGPRAAVAPHAGGGGSRQEGKFFNAAAAAASGISSSEFAAARQRALQDKQHRALPVLASLVTSESDFRLARRLVGSVHHWHLGLGVQLYVSYAIPAEQLSEARAWQDVAVILPDALSKDLEPILAAPAAASALLGGHSVPMNVGGDHWTPWRLAAALHAAKSSASGSAMYLEPWAVITGWLDHLFKELQRDGTLHVCDSDPSGPRGYVSGVSLKATAAMEQLQRQVECLLLEQQQQEEEGDEPRAPCSHMQPPGPEVRCHRPETVLIEMGSRPRGGGRGGDVSDPDSLLSQPELQGGAGEEEEEGGGRRDREMAKYACLVRLRHLGSGLEAELRAEAKTPAAPQPGQRHIALGVPCSTGKRQPQHQEQQHMTAPPVVGSLLPSVLATARQQGGRYRYTLLVGFEAGDSALDDPPQLQQLQRSAEQQLSGDGRVSVALRAFRLPAAGSDAALWNALFDIAAQEGADYFMAAHQGTELPAAASAFGGGDSQQHQQLWSDALVQSLLENPMRRNFGVASPMARGRPRSLTHPMVHVQTHRDVFGTMFPDALVLGGGPQGPEKWVSHVYGAHSTFLLTNVAVALPVERSMGGGGTSSPERACGADAAERAVDFAVEDSSAKMREWLEANGGAEEL